VLAGGGSAAHGPPATAGRNVALLTLPIRAGLGPVHVLGTTADPDAVLAGTTLAHRSGGRYLRVDRPTALPAALTALLG